MEFELPPPPSPQQQAIIAAVASGKGNILVDATAGSGKTFTLLQALAQCPQKSILFVAFGKALKDELEAKIAKQGVRKGWAVHVRTFHALGREILLKNFRHLKVAERGAATDKLIRDAAQGVRYSFATVRAASKLLRTYKESGDYPRGQATWRPSIGVFSKLGADHNIFGPSITPDEAAHACRLAYDAYLPGLDFANRESIDFCDMVWGCVVRDLAPPSRYQAVMVDELQDASAPQLLLVNMVTAPNGRLISVGDQHQQLYQFRGSLGKKAWDLLETERAAVRLPLSVSFRCSRAVIAEAQKVVPEIEARPDAPEGSVTRIELADAARAITPRAVESTPGYFHTFVLSRLNGALLEVALKLWVAGSRFQLRLDEGILEPIYELLDKKLDLRSPSLLTKTLQAWLADETKRAEERGSTDAADRAEDMAAMISAVARYKKPHEIKGTLTSILRPNDSGVLLSTVHKAKGLEAERVFLLRGTFARHAKPRPCRYCRGSGGCNVCFGDGRVPVEITEADINIEFVAITRAKLHLIWVNDGEAIAEVAPEARPDTATVAPDLSGAPTKPFDDSDAGLAKLATGELKVLLHQLEAAEELPNYLHAEAPDVRLDRLLRIRRLLAVRAEIY